MDTAQDLIRQTIELLGISKTRLAGLLDVTEKSLFDWRDRGAQDLPPKARRLLRLYEVSKALDVEIRRRGNCRATLMDVLSRGLIPTPDGTEMTLAAYVCLYPNDFGWRGNVTAALDDYLVTRKYKTATNMAQREGASLAIGTAR